MARRRRIATLVMVLGLCASVATVGFGGVQYWRASRLLSALQSQCESDREVFAKSSATLGDIDPSQVDPYLKPTQPPLPPDAIPSSRYKEKAHTGGDIDRPQGLKVPKIESAGEKIPQ